MEPQNGIKAWQWVVTIVVIIILVVVGIMVFNGKQTATDIEDQSSDVVMDDNNNDINRIVMSDQYPGNVVYISSVQLAKPGWVVIHTDNKGKPGKVIGSAYFDTGINPGKITLTQTVTEDGIYYAMLHIDDGDKKFDEAKDAPLKDISGNIIMKLFRVSSSVNVDIKG